MRKYLLLLLILISTKMFAQDTSHKKEPVTITLDADDFVKTETPSSYPGGRAAWKNVITNSDLLQATLSAASKKGMPPGQYLVSIKFVVEKDGTVTEVTPLTKFGFGLEEGAIKIIEKSGKWVPAQQLGKPVKSWHTQPFTFVIAKD